MWRPADRLRPASVSLIGRRVLLRSLRPQDFDQWRDVRRRSVEWLVPWEPKSHPDAPDVVEERGAFAQRCAARDAEARAGTMYPFGIFADGQFCGEVNANQVYRGVLQSCVLGYWIDTEFAGRGLMPESVALLMQFAFDTLGLHRVEAAIIPRNLASIRVAEKLGMRPEGLAQRLVEINGVWEDHIRFALTAEEWAERKDQLLRDWVW